MLLNKYKGSVLGAAVGDALGAPVEFKKSNSFPAVSDYVERGSHDLMKGMWTDDTSMLLCSAISLINKQGFDVDDHMTLWLKWYDNGYMSSSGFNFGCGGVVSTSLVTYRRDRVPFNGPRNHHTAGNGSLMRISPIPLYFNKEPPESALTKSVEASKMTHRAPAALEACKYFSALILGALRGCSKEQLLSEYYNPTENPNYWTENPLKEPEIVAIATGKYKSKRAGEIKSSGYVVHTLECALWALHTTNSFRAGMLKIVNKGEDSDTVACVYGQLAGAIYGASGIPTCWISELSYSSFIECIADKLYYESQKEDNEAASEIYSVALSCYDKQVVLFSEITTFIKDCPKPVNEDDKHKIKEKKEAFQQECNKMAQQYPTNTVVKDILATMHKIVGFYGEINADLHTPRGADDRDNSNCIIS